jgi:hypothetical protein
MSQAFGAKALDSALRRRAALPRYIDGSDLPAESNWVKEQDRIACHREIQLVVPQDRCGHGGMPRGS